jgi:hypothetical protein
MKAVVQHLLDSNIHRQVHAPIDFVSAPDPTSRPDAHYPSERVALTRTELLEYPIKLSKP